MLTRPLPFTELGLCARQTRLLGGRVNTDGSLELGEGVTLDGIVCVASAKGFMPLAVTPKVAALPKAMSRKNSRRERLFFFSFCDMGKFPYKDNSSSIVLTGRIIWGTFLYPALKRWAIFIHPHGMRFASFTSKEKLIVYQ
jgi:hypothetical protein